MAFIVKKNIHGNDYYYLNETKRIDGKVKTKTLAYLGKSKKDAEKKKKEFFGKREEKEVKEEIKSKKPKIIPKEIDIEGMAVFCKRKGFVYPSSEIYGGFAGFWDFGALGVELNNNIKKTWWNFHVQQRKDVVGIDGSIITNPKVWKASGHVDSFSDVFVTCKKCKKDGKLDKNEIEEVETHGGVRGFRVKGKLKCEHCGGEYDTTSFKDFKLMFETNVGKEGKSYLRPETAQLIFTNFKNVFENSRMKLPFGIAQIGKAFRNEIAPRDFLFRAREFEQMEIEYFTRPEEACPYGIPDEKILVYSAEAQEKNKEPIKMKIRDALKKKIIKKDWHAYWLALEFSWFKNLGANPNKFRIRQHMKDELAHYSTDCWDLEYEFPFGWKELEGIADRTDYDLKQHEKFSGKDLKVFDEKTKQKILPHVVCEPSQGVGRAFLVFMFDSYTYDSERENIVLKLNSQLAPFKAAVLPLVKKPEFEKIAKDVFEDLKKEFNVSYDASASIGRRYARNDEIGTPYCITVDGDSIKKQDVTIRDRDSTKQIRIKIKDLKNILRNLIDNEIVFEKIGKIIN